MLLMGVGHAYAVSVLCMMEMVCGYGGVPVQLVKDWVMFCRKIFSLSVPDISDTYKGNKQ